MGRQVCDLLLFSINNFLSIFGFDDFSFISLEFSYTHSIIAQGFY